MAEASTSTNPGAAGDRQELLAEPCRTDRDRRRVEREVCRVLSESRTIAIWVGFIVFGHVFGFALLTGDGRLTLVAGGIAFGCLFALAARVEPEPFRPKGEIALMPEPAFERLLESVEREARLLASGATAASGSHNARDSDSFERLVGEAIDDLPEFLRVELERNVPVVISDDGDSHGAYGYYGAYIGGLYIGATMVGRGWSHQIIIFRDTLVRDYGTDPDTLRQLVTMTLRHELAHHLGAGERHVAELGLSDLNGPRPPKRCGTSTPVHPTGRRSVARSPTNRSTARGTPRPAGRAVTQCADDLRPPAWSSHVAARWRLRMVVSVRRSPCPHHRARPPPARRDPAVAVAASGRRSPP